MFRGDSVKKFCSFPPPNKGGREREREREGNQRNYSTAAYILLDSLKGSPGDNISTLLKKKWNPVCKSEDVQTLPIKTDFICFINVE